MTAIRQFGATQKVLEYLRKHPDVSVPYTEIYHETGLRIATISNSVGYLIDKGIGVERQMRGMVIYHSARQVTPVKPPVKATTELYEYIGDMGDRAVIRDWNNQLYVAIPLEAFYRKDT